MFMDLKQPPQGTCSALEINWSSPQKTMGRKDVAVERTRKYSQRVLEEKWQ